jgi:DNA repair and recombination protein RAD52
MSAFSQQQQQQMQLSPYAAFEDRYMEITLAQEAKIGELQAKLNQQLGPEYLSTRPGPGGSKPLTYAEGWKILNLANEVFGFHGWSSSVQSMTTDFLDCDPKTNKWTGRVSAIVRVTIRGGAFHEDIGTGSAVNQRDRIAVLDKVRHLFAGIVS